MSYKQPEASHSNILVLRGLTNNVKPLDTIHIFDQIDTESKKTHADSKISLPRFNTDRLYFTPAFLLPKQQNYYKLNETFERYIFKEKIQRNLQFLKPIKTELAQQNIRFSSPANEFCQICQQKYENYFEHTSSLEHQLLAKNSDFNKSIQQLCNNFKGKNKKKIVKMHKTMLQKHNHREVYKLQTRLGKLRVNESNKSQSQATRIISE